jgi:hypothetical protein
MGDESRFSARNLRRPKKQSERPDYSEPDFSSWAAKLDSFVPAAQSAPASPPVAAPPAPVAAPAATAAEVRPQAPPSASFDERPSLERVLDKVLNFEGAMCVAIVDSETGMILSKAGSGIDIDLAAAGASVILRARLASTKALRTNEKIDNLLISLTSQVHIIHPLPSEPSIFTYLIADKSRSSLAMAMYKATEADLQIQL